MKLKCHLWNGTEVKDTLVVQAGQVGDNIGNVPQSVGDQKVETGQRRLQLLRLSQVLQTACKLTPRLYGNTGQKSPNCW